jgi:hypothetical protein
MPYLDHATCPTWLICVLMTLTLFGKKEVKVEAIPVTDSEGS